MDTKIDLSKCQNLLQGYRKEMAKKIVGQEELVDGMLIACIAGGHILLEGVPGLAKTLAVKTFADITALSFKRIQFTPDLLPADVVGTLIYDQSSMSFTVRKGPVFANLVLADEINRAPAKVQSALLEAMAEQQVTIGDKTYELPRPFFVLATQNPIEQEGTYALPEAELDRFLMKLHIPYPSLEDEKTIIKTSVLEHTSEVKEQKKELDQVLSSKSIDLFRKAASQVQVADSIVQYIVSIIAATRGSQDLKKERRHRDDYLQYISFGASPRASLALTVCARIQALFEGRDYVIPEDVKAVAYKVLRHRLVLSYEAGADNLSADDIISKILSIIPVP